MTTRAPHRPGGPPPGGVDGYASARSGGGQRRPSNGSLPTGPGAPRTSPGAQPSAGGSLLAGPTALGALAVVGGATALTPLIVGLSWLLPVIEVVAVVWLVGIGARLLRALPLITGLLQLVALGVALTSLFTTTGIGGVLPGPAAISQAASMVGGAWDQIMTTVPPASVTTELSLFIALLIGMVALLTDLLIAGAGAPAMVALPLLALYAVPASIYSGMLPWYAFVLPAGCYAALLAVSGHRGVRARSNAAVSLSVSTALIATIAIVGALVITDAATGIGTNGRIPHTGHSGGPIGLSPWALLRGQLTDDAPEDVLTVSGLAHPTYLRTFTLEKWTEDKGFGFGPVAADVTDFDGAVPGAPAQGSSAVTATVTPQNYRDKYLPIYADTTAVNGIGTGWSYDKSLGTVFRTDPTVPKPYTVTVAQPTVTAAELRQENVQSGGPLTQTGTLPAQVVSLAKSITAGTKNPFDAVDALLHYFTDPANGFTYSLSTPLGNSGSALVDFLTDKRGYCEQYAAAMAIMVRSLGIPARVGIGFTQGAEQSDGTYEVTSTDAHAWVEVKFDKSGWVMFDPTPQVEGQGGLQGFVAGPAQGPSASASTTPSTGASTTSTAPSTTHSLQGAPLTQGQKIPGADATPGAVAATGSTWGRYLPGVLIALVVIAAAALLLAGPSMVRRARRRRRLLRAASRSPGAGSAAWQEIYDTLVDHGMSPGSEETARSVANQLARTAQLPTAGREQLKTVITSAEKDWYAMVPVGGGGTPDLAPSVRAVIRALDHAKPQPWARRIWPRSLRRR